MSPISPATERLIGDFIGTGPVVGNPQVCVIFVGDWSSAANQSRQSSLTTFVGDFLNSSYMNVLAQYGCGSCSC